MDFQKIRVEKGRSKVTLVISNPKANTLSGAVLEELSVALDEVEREKRIKSVTITGEGERFFSAGADLNEIAGVVLNDTLSIEEKKSRALNFSLRGQTLVLRLKYFSKPVTALINGVCVGGGFELALGCHRRVALSHAVIGLPEVTLGIIPGWGGTYFLPMLSSERMKNQAKLCHENERLLSLLERRFTAGTCIPSIISQGIILCPNTALKYGIIDKIISSGIEETPSSTSRKALPLFAVRSVMTLLKRHAMDGNDEKEALVAEAQMFSAVCVSNDAREGIAAFLEKRHPRFET